jgi:hypothetical protein
MRKVALVRGLLMACAAVSWSNAAFAQATTAAQYLVMLKNYGFVDGPGSFSITSGNDNYTFAASSVSNALTQFNAQYPSHTVQQTVLINGVQTVQTVVQNQNVAQTIANSNFADIFGGNAPHSLDIAGSPALLTQYPKLATAPFSGSITFAGVTLNLNFPANSNTLTLNVTGTSINQTFTGTTRAAAITQFETYAQNNQSYLLNQIHNAFAGTTITDPVIGNPQSLTGQMASLANFFGTPVGENDTGVLNQKIDPILAVTAQPQYYTADSLNGFTFQVPLAYSWFNQDDPRYAVTIDMPLSYQKQGPMESYNGGLGVGMRVPLADHWYVTPQAHISAIASVNSQAGGVQYGAIMFSFAASSKYNIYLDDNDLKLSIIDTGGYYHSVPFDIGKLSLNPNIESGIFSNGFTAETPANFTLFGNRATWQGYVLDSRVVGTHSQIAGWDEIGVSFGTADDMTAQTWENLRIGATFSFAREDYKAYELNVTERF